VITQRNKARIQEEEEAEVKKEKRKKAERERKQRKHSGAHSINQSASSSTVYYNRTLCLNRLID
jgi:hypothetical protein